MILEPGFVADVVQDGLPPDRIEFVSQRSVAVTGASWSP
jgi:hypothetical protein